MKKQELLKILKQCPDDAEICYTYSTDDGLDWEELYPRGEMFYKIDKNVIKNKYFIFTSYCVKNLGILKSEKQLKSEKEIDKIVETANKDVFINTPFRLRKNKYSETAIEVCFKILDNERVLPVRILSNGDYSCSINNLNTHEIGVTNFPDMLSLLTQHRNKTLQKIREELEKELEK